MSQDHFFRGYPTKYGQKYGTNVPPPIGSWNSHHYGSKHCLRRYSTPQIMVEMMPKKHFLSEGTAGSLIKIPRTLGNNMINPSFFCRRGTVAPGSLSNRCEQRVTESWDGAEDCAAASTSVCSGRAGGPGKNDDIMGIVSGKNTRRFCYKKYIDDTF